MKNRYVARSRISEAVFRRFLRHVAADLTAVQIAQLSGLNRNTNRLLAYLRERMAEACELERPFSGTIVGALGGAPAAHRGAVASIELAGKTYLLGWGGPRASQTHDHIH